MQKFMKKSLQSLEEVNLADFFSSLLLDFAFMTSPWNEFSNINVDFYWCHECKRSLRKIKTLNDNVVVDFILVLAKDPSPIGLIVVLSQRLRDISEGPIAFGSGKLRKNTANLTRKLLIWVLRSFSIIVTHENLFSSQITSLCLPYFVRTKPYLQWILCGYSITISFY